MIVSSICWQKIESEKTAWLATLYVLFFILITPNEATIVMETMKQYGATILLTKNAS